jgi:hypothetical protein
MLDQATLAKARSELGRLNNELHALHLEEERAKLKRSRLEGDKARLQALVDLGDLLIRLTDAPSEGPRFTVPGGKNGKDVTFRVENCHGAKLIVAEKISQPASQQHTLADMCVTVLGCEDVPAEGMTPAEVTRIIRGAWRPDADTRCVNATLWRLASEGRLGHAGRRYRLNGYADE